MPVTIDSLASIKGRQTIVRDGGSAVFDVSEGLIKTVTDGTGIDQANALYIDDFSIAASGTLDIDLSGTLVDAHGTTAVFTAIKEIMVIADVTNTNDIAVGNGGVNSFLGPFAAAANTVSIKPGNRFDVTNYSAAGWAVTAGTGDILRLANSAAGTAVTGTIVIVGRV